MLSGEIALKNNHYYYNYMFPEFSDPKFKMAVRLNDQNKRELDIYTKNFILKAFQVIVQSRMGEIDRYTAKDNLTTDWVMFLSNY